MTIYMTPNISDEQIEQLDVFDAFRKGEELFESRFPRDAVRVLRKVVDAEPNNASAWELIGRAHFAAAQLVPAEQAFRRLIELDPSNAWAQTALALSLDRQSRRDEGAVHHRIATAMGMPARGGTRVELVDQPIG